ncbi:MAG: hypothetical protein KC912_05165 [Proteobacteria bacterium]|nr:hypothetical protein [Pseudomonadota bacterium]
MGFKMVCPKCNSLNYSVERDGRSYIRTGPSAELIFSCRCGTQLFGENLTKEFDKQRAAFEAEAKDRVAEEREREERAAEQRERDETMRRALEFRQNYLREQKAAQVAEAREAKAESDRAWRQRVAAGGGSVSAPATASNPAPASAAAASGSPLLPPGTPLNKPDSLCGWGPCPNDARSNSKYCSRACSNKNARWRHKKRRKEPGE